MIAQHKKLWCSNHLFYLRWTFLHWDGAETFHQHTACHQRTFLLKTGDFDPVTLNETQEGNGKEKNGIHHQIIIFLLFHPLVFYFNHIHFKKFQPVLNVYFLVRYFLCTVFKTVQTFLCLFVQSYRNLSKKIIFEI